MFHFSFLFPNSSKIISSEGRCGGGGNYENYTPLAHCFCAVPLEFLSFHNQVICLVMYSSAEYITLALKCRKVNVSKRMDDITSGTIVFEKNLQSPEFRNSLKQQHYGAEVKVKKKMSAKLAAELCTWMNYTMEATNCMLNISNLSLSRRETKIFIGIVYGTYKKNSERKKDLT